jgi:hypothetical protein
VGNAAVLERTIDDNETAADTSVRAPRRFVDVATGQWGVAVVAAVAAMLAWWFADRHDLTQMYADARSHLSISRRIVDGTNSGFTQIGTVWLPLPHLVVAPFSVVTSWWRNGFAVLPVNVAALIIEALCLFRIVGTAARSKAAAWMAVLLLVANPGWLYLHTTSLGEPVLFATVLLLVAGLSGWANHEQPYSGGMLTIFCGLPAAAAVLSRYDGWAFALAGAAFIAFVAQRRWGQWRYTLRCVRSFCVAPAVAALWWMWFNWVNWGDPLEFQRGQWSAQAQQQILDDAGLLPDKGDLFSSVHTFGLATWRGGGVVLVAAGLVGAVLWFAAKRFSVTALAPWLLLVVPIGFYLLSLFTGQIALRLGTDADPSMFNLRYGLQVLPGFAAFAALGATVLARMRVLRWPTVAASAVVVLAAAAMWWPAWREVPVVAEGIQQRELGDPAWRAAEYLREHAVDSGDTGVIVFDDSRNPMLGVVGADLNRVAGPFDGKRWRRTLADLESADWVFVDRAGDGDAVAAAIDADPSFDANFDEVFSDGTISVYRGSS